MKITSITFFSYLFLIGVALGAEYHISSADELISFSNNVNGGTTYVETTVFLDSDIDFSEVTDTFKPIGTQSDNTFRGTFDGQGHIVNNLKVNAGMKHTALFGYSTGLSVKNIVISPTCTVNNTYTATGVSAFFSGIIAECEQMTEIASSRTV